MPVYFHAVTVSGEGKMVMFGGVDSIEQNTRTNKVFFSLHVIFVFQCLLFCFKNLHVIFSMLSSVTKQVFTAWLTVPSLRAMAWEAVCHYTPHIAKLPKVNFTKLSLPSI